MMTIHNTPIIFLMGPTASGKTALASYLYRNYPVEIISVDSALVYRGMDIGTAKPTTEELIETPHFLINIKDPSEIYSAAQFRRDALNYIAEIIARGNTPLLVGGTMLYFKALLEGLSPLPEASPEVRRAIETRAQHEGWKVLHDELAKIDPETAARIHPNDPQRLIRALEVFMLSGQSMSELTKTVEQKLDYPVLQIAINPLERHILHRNIETRFMAMLNNGFEEEVRQLMLLPNLHPDLPSMRSVGYRQMWHYLSGTISKDEMIFKSICATRQLAKRQLTWLRGWQDLHWIEPNNFIEIENLIAKTLNKQ